MLECIRFVAAGSHERWWWGSTSSKKLISEILNFGLDFSLSFLDEFLLDFAGTYLLFSLGLGVAKSPFLDRFLPLRIFISGFENAHLEIM